jgi:hypothetical protein
MSFQEIGAAINDLIISILSTTVVVSLKKINHKYLNLVFWLGMMLHSFGLIRSLYNKNWLFAVFILIMGYNVYVYINKPATPK